MNLVCTTKIERKGMCLPEVEMQNCPMALLLTKLARILTYILRQKNDGMFFCLPLSYRKPNDVMP